MMKLRPSLKVYFAAMMLITGVTIISIMSAVSINSFFVGIDFYLVDAMRFEANRQDVSDGKPVKINNFTVASRWQDLPEPVKAHLNQQALEDNKLLKFIDGNPIFSKPKSGYFVMRLNHQGHIRYVSSMFVTPIPPPLKMVGEQQNKLSAALAPPREDDKPRFYYIILFACIAIVLFPLVPYFILRRVTKPVENLMQWADKLDNDNLTNAIPDFHYSELNQLAKMIKASLHSVQETLAREKKFLGYASHELRTPIAVARTNSELLRKMMKKNINLKKQEQVVTRIERACLTMTDLTETLLWLNRVPSKLVPMNSFAIGELIEKLIIDLDYLYKGKPIILNKETDNSCYVLPEALCRIIMTNLLRNAFQHTQQGIVSITQSATCITIANENVKVHEKHINEHAVEINGTLGFGLGLELTERLVQHYGWKYDNVARSNGHFVEIDFAN